MSDYAIQVNNASFSYGDKEVFSSLSFKVKNGEIFCIVGPNGCGKTTLLNIILGLLKLKQGNIIIDNSNIENYSPKLLAEKIAYVPQIHQRTFPYKVREIVLMGRAYNTSIFSSPPKEDMLIAEHAMEKTGILHLADKPYTQISGGECQLVMIARALAQQPKIIVMDEPTSHLDFKNELVLLEAAVDLARRENITIMMATHVPNHAFYFEARRIPTTIALMSNETFMSIGSPQEVLNENNIRSIYNINSKVLNHLLNDDTSITQIVPISIIKDV